MTPLDLKTKEEWEGILTRFSADTKMTASLTDDAGKILLSVNSRYPLCSAIRENPDALTFVCSQTNTAMLAVVSKTLEPVVDLCEAGLIRVVVPVLHDGSLIGQVTACGLASNEDEPDAFLVAKQLDITEEKVLELAQSTPSGSEEELEQICSRLLDEISKK
jgi:ligand-binding sensor protein